MAGVHTINKQDYPDDFFTLVVGPFAEDTVAVTLQDGLSVKDYVIDEINLWAGAIATVSSKTLSVYRRPAGVSQATAIADDTYRITDAVDVQTGITAEAFTKLTLADDPKSFVPLNNLIAAGDRLVVTVTSAATGLEMVYLHLRCRERKA